jgi:hypothetical protein
MWWRGNEKLKGMPIALSTSAQRIPASKLNLQKGLVLEATLSCAGDNSNVSAGFLVHANYTGVSGGCTGGNGNCETDACTAFLWSCARQVFIFGQGYANGSVVPQASEVDRNPGFPAHADVHLRLLLRAVPGSVAHGGHQKLRGMAEFYANDVLSHPASAVVDASSTVVGTVGTGDAGAVAVSGLQAWTMTL